MSARLLETLLLPADAGLRFLDACTRQPVTDGLRCTLYLRRGGRVLGLAVATPSGVHHWPNLAPRWRGGLGSSLVSPPVSPPAPANAWLAEILVEDRLDRYLPLRLPWPAEPDAGSPQLSTMTLCSAPQRGAPSGAATVHALLADGAGAPAAWVRVLVTDAQSRTTVGMSDAAGRLTLHLPCPRPERRMTTSPPDSPPAAPGMGSAISLRVFHDPALGAEALAAAGQDGHLPVAPFLPGWSAQPEVRALARVGASDPCGPLRLEVDRPSVPVTEGLPPNRSELRLAPL